MCQGEQTSAEMAPISSTPGREPLQGAGQSLQPLLQGAGQLQLEGAEHGGGSRDKQQAEQPQHQRMLKPARRPAPMEATARPSTV